MLIITKPPVIVVEISTDFLLVMTLDGGRVVEADLVSARTGERLQSVPIEVATEVLDPD
ncbi:MAG: hypothetical protein OXU20_06960 [Myxococcales bacterium]|nr:hypothetical protein [Myxococcales bacterium]